MTIPLTLNNTDFIVEASVISLAELLTKSQQEELIRQNATIIVEDKTADVFLNGDGSWPSAELYVYVPEAALVHYPEDYKKTKVLSQITTSDGCFVEVPVTTSVARNVKDIQDFYFVCKGKAPSQFELTFKTEQDKVSYTVLIGHVPNFYIMRELSWNRACYNSSEIKRLQSENKTYRTSIIQEGNKDRYSVNQFGKLVVKPNNINKLVDKITKNNEAIEYFTNEISADDSETKAIINNFKEKYQEAKRLYEETKTIENLQDHIKDMSKKLREDLGSIKTKKDYFAGVSKPTLGNLAS